MGLRQYPGLWITTGKHREPFSDSVTIFPSFIDVPESPFCSH